MQEFAGKKILLAHSIFRPEKRGGAEVVVDNIAYGLKRRGAIVAVATVGRKNDQIDEAGVAVYHVAPANLFNFLDINGQPAAKRFFWHLIDMMNNTQTWRLYQIIKDFRPEAVMTHNLKGLSYLLPRVVASMGLKNIHTIHDMQLLHPSGLIPENERLGLLSRMYLALCRWLFGSPDTVIFPSQYIKNVYLRYGFFKHSKIRVLGNPLPDGLKIGIRKPEAEIKKSEAAEPFTIAYAGQIEEYKGITDLIKAVDGLPGEWQLLIAGDGGAMREAVRWSVGNKRIKMLGRLTPDELERQIWSVADLLVNPSRTPESFGMNIIEAYARGVPVLAAEIGALPELVKSGETGELFRPQDIFDLKRQLEFILANREIFKSYKANAVKAAARFELGSYLERALTDEPA